MIPGKDMAHLPIEEHGEPGDRGRCPDYHPLVYGDRKFCPEDSLAPMAKPQDKGE